MSETPKELLTGQDGPNRAIVELVVRICQDEFGRLWSWHDVDPNYAEKIKQWPGGGVKQIAHGLLLEAVRREAFASALVLMGSDEGFLQRYWEADEAEKGVMEKSLADAVYAVLAKNICPLSEPAAKEILLMMALQKFQP